MNASLPAGWVARVPELGDVAALVALRGADHLPWTGSAGVDEAAVESEVAGTASWTRRQLVAVDPDGAVRAWVSVHDRAAGRTMIAVYVDRSPEVTDDVAAAIAAAFYAWACDRALEIAELREVPETRLDASPFSADHRQLAWLAAAGFTKRRSWLHMTRPVDDAGELPGPREGVTIRQVAQHENGLPVAEDLQLVHRMLEESFEDHFNSYRESFPEFVQRLREDPGHRWDHWWLAFVDPEGSADDGGVPAGAVVCSVLAAAESGHEGTYVEYIGVNRAARGRGVAKGLLHTVIRDAAERGRDRVCLEVDADSPTSADELYVSMGWRTEFITDSWFLELRTS